MPLDVVVDTAVAVRGWSAFGCVHGVEHHVGVRVVDGHTDLHLEDAVAADPHLVREHERMADLPVVALLGLTDQEATLDDAVFERIERDLLVLVAAERFGHRRALLLGDELEVVPVQRFDVVRIDGVLHDLQPTARDDRVADVADALHRVRLVPRQLWCRAFADVGPHESAELLRFTRTNAAAGAELGRRVGLGEDLDALARRVELPAVVAAAQTVVFDDAVDE